MDRRSFLQTVGSGSIVASAGCLTSALGGDGGKTVLAPPEDRRYDSSELPYPAYGQPLPDFALPDPVRGTTIDTSTLDETLVVTGFFASCPVECIRLIARLASVQRETIQAGIADEVTFLAITFDPQRDDAEALRNYGEKMHIDLDANWHFLRPPTPERANEVVEKKLGITYDRIGAGQSERLPGYDFKHLSLSFLRNPTGIVERAYRTDSPSRDRVFSDVKAVVEAMS